MALWVILTPLSSLSTLITDSIEANVETAAVNVEEGRKQLSTAQQYQVLISKRDRVASSRGRGGTPN